MGANQILPVSSCICSGNKNVYFGHKFVHGLRQNYFIFGKEKSTLGKVSFIKLANRGDVLKGPLLTIVRENKEKKKKHTKMKLSEMKREDETLLREKIHF